MKHKYKLQDATKQELIEYFFGIDEFGGGYRIPADVDRFLIWLGRKRTDTLLNSQTTAIEAAQKALHEYVEYVHQANDEPDLDKKMGLFEKANAAYKRYENFNEQYDLLDKKVKKSMDGGW